MLSRLAPVHDGHPDVHQPTTSERSSLAQPQRPSRRRKTRTEHGEVRTEYPAAAGRKPARHHLVSRRATTMPMVTGASSTAALPSGIRRAMAVAIGHDRG